MLKIQPTPILIESSEKKTSEIIELMISQKTSYVLLINENSQISGIFTDKDVLRLFYVFQKPGNLDFPILNYMVKPVHTLYLSEIHRAPELMVKSNIRHVPIIHDKNIVGIVTENSIFKTFVSSKSEFFLSMASLFKFDKEKTVGIISPDGEVFFLFKNLWNSEAQINLKRYFYNDLQSKNAIQAIGRNCQVLILDVDELPFKSWFHLLVELNAMNLNPNIFIFLTAEKHPSDFLDKVEQLKSIQWLHIYFKPFNISHMMDEINQIMLT